MKFRLVEENKKNITDILNTLVDNFEKMTEEEILELSTEGITNTIESNSPMFISPSGKIIDVKKLTGLSNPMHLDFVYDLLYYKLNEIDKEIKMEDITDVSEYVEAEELEYLADKGWIRINTGTSSVEKRFYCVLPYRDAIKPTERQYDVLKEFIEYGIEKNKKQLLIYYGDSAKWYNLQNEEAQDIIKEIKRYYAGFNESLNEVYPNKGESKKDFIARFMSVTKDEYPDVKQRYAVALSYWDRKDKKK